MAWLGLALGAGLASGILAKAADAPGSREAGIITSNVAIWVLGVALWGALSPGPVDAAVRSKAWWSGAVLAVVAAIAMTDEPVSRAWRWVAEDARWLPQAPVAVGIALATWAIVVLVLPRHRPTRLWGLAFAVPGFLLIDWVFRISWPMALTL